LSRIILHIDMDAFFSQIEELANPRLKGKPLVVCGDPNRRSVVSTASYEARKYGIKSGMAVGLARKMCPHSIFIRGNPQKYVYTSVQILKLLRDFTRAVEPFSVDEAFLEFEGIDIEDALEIALKIKGRIKDEFGLTGSIGIGPNKFVAKMASGLQKPDGLTLIRDGEFVRVFGDKPVIDLWGVGEKTCKKLNRLGVATIGDLARYPEKKLEEMFGIYGSDLKRAANGIDDSPVLPYYEPHEPKSMGHEFTLPYDIGDRENLLPTLLWLSEKLARRMRREGYLGDTVTVKIRDDSFNTTTRQRKMDELVDRDDLIYQMARRLFEENYRGEKIRLLGISISGLVKKTEVEEEPMFHSDKKYDLFIRTMDSIRDKFGEKSIRRGAGIRA